MTVYKDSVVADSLKRVVNFYNKYNRKPNTVTVAGKPINWSEYVKISQITAKQSAVDKFRKENGRTPNYVTITELQLPYKVYNALFEKATVIKTDGDSTFDYFTKIFGKVGTIDEALGKVKDKGYGHYFNDLLSNKQVIDYIKAGKGVNCTDSCQMFWHIAKQLGYDVKCIHVKCKGGDGHVRLQLRHSKHTGGNWINRDPACVLSNNGKAVTAIWCSDGKIIDTNPAWFMETLNK